MSTYKCIRAFKSERGKHYSYGDEINSMEYFSLDSTERSNFSIRETSSDAYTRSSPNDDFLNPLNPLNPLSPLSVWNNDDDVHNHNNDYHNSSSSDTDSNTSHSNSDSSSHSDHSSSDSSYDSSSDSSSSSSSDW